MHSPNACISRSIEGFDRSTVICKVHEISSQKSYKLQKITFFNFFRSIFFSSIKNFFFYWNKCHKDYRIRLIGKLCSYEISLCLVHKSQVLLDEQFVELEMDSFELQFPRRIMLNFESASAILLKK